MIKYVVLGNWTDKGRETLKDDYPQRLETSRKIVEDLGGKMDLNFTLGEYDFVGIISAPDEESVTKMLLKVNSMGKFTTKTLRAWTAPEFIKLVTEL